MNKMSEGRGANDATSAETAPAQATEDGAVAGLQVVLGASGGTGGAVVRELARRGSAVRAVSRIARSPRLPASKPWPPT